jgi:hypothetical protein
MAALTFGFCVEGTDAGQPDRAVLGRKGASLVEMVDQRATSGGALRMRLGQGLRRRPGRAGRLRRSATSVEATNPNGRRGRASTVGRCASIPGLDRHWPAQSL